MVQTLSLYPKYDHLSVNVER